MWNQFKKKGKKMQGTVQYNIPHGNQEPVLDVSDMSYS